MIGRLEAPWRNGAIRLALSAALSLSVGCGPQSGSSTAEARDASAGGGSGLGEDASISRCIAPAGTSSSPRTIFEVLALLNALPKPVTLPCFLETLEHPLSIHATKSEFSAQPASGDRSPRIFLFVDPLILSIVPEGTGARLLEFGERRSETHSLKAELEFPITTELDESALFERLPFNETVSTCGFCHQGEEPAPDIDLPFAMISPGIRPMPKDRVSISRLHEESMVCDAEAEPERCAMLEALFIGAELPIDREFPETFPTFF